MAAEADIDIYDAIEEDFTQVSMYLKLQLDSNIHILPIFSGENQ